MTHQERNMTIEFIRKAYEFVIFQHEQERLDMMLAKYVNPATVISKQELAEDLKFLEKLSD